MPKVVYIAHQITGDAKANAAAVRRIMRAIHSDEIIPIAPYLTAIEYLDCGVREEFTLGIATNREHFRRRFMDEVWLCGPRISDDMRDEIRLAIRYGIPVRCYNLGLQEEYERLLEPLMRESAIEEVLDILFYQVTQSS